MSLWPKVVSAFSNAATEDELQDIHRQQLQWMLTHHVSGAWSQPSTFFQGSISVRDPKQNWVKLQVHQAPYGARVVATEVGPLLFVPRTEQRYRMVYRVFVAHYGFQGEVSESHIDHVVPTSAVGKYRGARVASSSANDTHIVVMAADAGVNQSWGQWESGTRESGLGYMPLLKGLGHKPPSADDRDDLFSGWLDAAVQSILALDDVPDFFPVPVTAGGETDMSLRACEMLDLTPGAMVEGEKWVRHLLLTEILEVRGLEPKKRATVPPLNQP